MARTKQTYRPPPRFKLGPDAAVTAGIKDHRGEPVIISWRPDPYSEEGDGYAGFPPFPWQVYILDKVSRAVDSTIIAQEFDNWIHRTGGISDGNCLYHFQVYSSGFRNPLDCIDHQNAECAHRIENHLWPYMVMNDANRVERHPHMGHLMVIDSERWALEGYLTVEYWLQTDGPESYRSYSGEILPDKLVNMTRCRDFSQLNFSLKSIWGRDGGDWIQSQLQELNAKPTNQLLYRSQGTLKVPEVIRRTVSIADVECGDLILQEHLDQSQCKIQSYHDYGGRKVTSVWDGRRSHQRPPYSLTLYVADEVRSFTPESIFSCINQEPMAEVEWCLDIIYGLPDVASATEHHAGEYFHREGSHGITRTRLWPSILHRILGDKLPLELIASIEEFSNPPPLPAYAVHSTRRPFNNIFLYMDTRQKEYIPMIVMNESIRRLPHLDEATATEKELRQHKLNLERRVNEEGAILIKISWRLLWMELHLLWSLGAPRHSLSPADVPSFSLRIDAPEILTMHDDFEMTPSLITLRLTSHSERPIWLPVVDIYSHRPFEDGIQVWDVADEVYLPYPPDREDLYSSLLPYEMWGYELWKSNHMNDLVHKGAVISPGETITITKLEGNLLWWIRRMQHLILRNGHSYQVRMIEGFALARWSFVSDDGIPVPPFNMPPIPIRVENTPTFLFKLDGLSYEC